MRNKIKVRTKLEAVVVVSILLCVNLGSVLGNRVITSTSDTIYTQIRNSNGNSWSATGSNLQLAIEDLYGVGTGEGTVYLPPGNIHIYNTIYVNDSVTILGAGIDNTFIKYANDNVDADMFKLMPNATEHGYFITFDSLSLDGNVETDHGSGIVANDSVRDLNIRNCFIKFFYEDGINISNAWGLQLLNVVIEYCDGWGAYIDGVLAPTITCCKIMTNGNNLFIGAGRGRITNSYIGDSDYTNIWVESADFTIFTNNFFYHSDDGSDLMTIKWCANCVITGNSFFGDSICNYLLRLYTTWNLTLVGNNFRGYLIDVVNNSGLSANYNYYDGCIKDNHGLEPWISNSNGMCYRNNSFGLQCAIWNLNNTDGGWVQVPYNFTIGTPSNSNNVFIYDMGNMRFPITEPYNPYDGSCWFNTSTGELGIYDGTNWLWSGFT